MMSISEDLLEEIFQIEGIVSANVMKQEQA